jgi:hypothetical protein
MLRERSDLAEIFFLKIPPPNSYKVSDDLY